MARRDRTPSGRPGGRQELCEPCRLQHALAERVAEVSERNKAERTPDDIRAQAARLLERAEGIETGTIPRPGTEA